MCDISLVLQILKNASKCINVCRDASECSKHYRTFQACVTQLTTYEQRALTCIKMRQYASTHHRHIVNMHKNVSSYSRRSSTCSALCKESSTYVHISSTCHQHVYSCTKHTYLRLRKTISQSVCPYYIAWIQYCSIGEHREIKDQRGFKEKSKDFKRKLRFFTFSEP